MFNELDRPSGSSGLSVKRIGVLAAFAGVSVTAIILLRDVLSFQTLADNRDMLLAWRDANYALAALAYVLIYTVAVAFSLPGAVFLTLTGGFLFGVIAGGLLTVAAATTGAVGIFLAARFGLGDFLAARMEASGGIVHKLRQGLQDNELSYLFVMRLVPAIPFFVANLVPALVGVRLRNYVIATFFGIMPGTFVYAWVGSGLGQVFAAGERPDLGIFFEWHILGPVLGLAALSALPIVLGKRGKAQA